MANICMLVRHVIEHDVFSSKIKKTEEMRSY